MDSTWILLNNPLGFTRFSISSFDLSQPFAYNNVLHSRSAVNLVEIYCFIVKIIASFHSGITDAEFGGDERYN